MISAPLLQTVQQVSCVHQRRARGRVTWRRLRPAAAAAGTVDATGQSSSVHQWLVTDGPRAQRRATVDYCALEKVSTCTQRPGVDTALYQTLSLARWLGTNKTTSRMAYGDSVAYS